MLKLTGSHGSEVTKRLDHVDRTCEICMSCPLCLRVVKYKVHARQRTPHGSGAACAGMHLHFAFGSSPNGLEEARHRRLCCDCWKRIRGRRECISTASLLPHPPLRPGLLPPSAYWLFSGICTSLHTPRTIGSSITLFSTWASFLTGAVYPLQYCKYHPWTKHSKKEL